MLFFPQVILSQTFKVMSDLTEIIHLFLVHFHLIHLQRASRRAKFSFALPLIMKNLEIRVQNL